MDNTKTAIITGGSRGIGKGIAEELAKSKYNLILVAKNVARLKKTSSEISTKYGVKVDFFKCDLSSTKEIDALYSFLTSKYTKLDALINNAGIYFGGSTGKSQMEKYDKMMAVNSRGMFYLTQTLLPILKKGHNQRVVIISSVWANDSYVTEGREDGTLYSISKWALRGWSRSLRAELRRYKIGVSIIYPGAVWTDEWKGTTIPQKEFIQPEDIGKIVRTMLDINPGTVIEEIIVRPISGDSHE